MVRNKKGWIRIVEAFVAVILIAAVVLIVMNKGFIGKDDISGRVYDAERAILREIETNDGLREEILEAPLVGGTSIFEVPSNVKNKVKSRLPNFLDCVVQICELDALCGLVEEIPPAFASEDIYAQKTAIAVTATTEDFDPRQLKMFCWVK